jgi:hypothetical protein
MEIKIIGNHYYDKESAKLYAKLSSKTFSVNIFKWIPSKTKSEGFTGKPSKGVVRVSGSNVNQEEVFKQSDLIVDALNNGLWTGNKTYKVK